MQRILGCFLIWGLLSFPSISQAVERLQFEREFGGKGEALGQFGQEVYLAFDQKGTIYISDSDNRRVQRLGPRPLEIKGGEGFLFNHPRHIAVDQQGRIYIADWRAVHIAETENPKLCKFMPCIYIFDAEGRFLRTIDMGDTRAKPQTVVPATAIVDQEGRYALAVKPKGWNRALPLTVSPQGEISVIDSLYHRILKFNLQGEKLLQFASYGSGPGQLDSPEDICTDREGYIYVADTGNHRIVKFDSNGKFVLSFGRKGLGDGEFIEPFAVVTTPSGRVLVADRAEFERRFEDHPFTGKKGRATPRWLEEDLLPQEEREPERQGEEPEEAGPPPKYLKVLRKVQIFSPAGRLLEKVVFKIDKTHPELHDLDLLALDPFGRVYLRDQDRYVIRRYAIVSYLLPRWSDVDKAYAARAATDRLRFQEDLGDLDTIADEQESRKHFTAKQAFSLSYDLSERSRLLLKVLNSYARRRDRLWDFDNPANNYDMVEKGTDSSVGMKFQYVVDPNLYSYRQMSISVQGLAGYTDYRGRATEEQLSLRHTQRNGDARALHLVTEYDLSPDATFRFTYRYIQPDQTTRNFKTYLYDPQGHLYYAERHWNRRELFVGELMVKF
ncbi:MAG: NHL repeat-containing protein [Candidatus Latescibacteria bacterium]|nr:NHL repeat-containing protein [Candidatus Latescibacterota bacterium]